MTTPSDPRQPETTDAPAEEVPTLNVYGENRTQTVARDVPNLNKRPPEMWAGAVFLTLAALPLLILGGGLAVLPGEFGTNLRDKLNSSGTAISADTLVLVFRVGGVVLLLVGLLLIWLAWTAVKPKRRARIGATVLAAVVVVGLAIVMIVTALDPVSIGVLLLAVAGVVLLFLPRSEEFMYTAR
ncbi:hypothetical protein [Pseudonocardia spinosispora]|uniref:hypothetical protein n=1 Tax=Pseudonocardia spinosispora TaxID=103441 RepID=UPI00048DA84D|nr:hypothetical protein [Pseudonocardia spinosispora]